jgi:F-type H+-transporting ATPase subunit b
MTLDWFTIAAQAVNFLVLFYLLKRFLFPPIVRAMDKREERIASRLNEAEEKRKEAEEAQATYEQKQQELKEERKKTLDSARQEAEKLRKDLEKDARDDVARMKKRWEESLRKQRDEFLDTLRHRTAQQVMATSRKALSDLADEELEHSIVSRFLKSLDDADKEDVKAIRDNLKKADDGITVSTAHKLRKDERERIEEALGSMLDSKVRPQFETSSDLMGGIELSVGDVRLGWNLRSYVDGLERELSRALKEGREQQGPEGNGEETGE